MGRSARPGTLTAARWADGRSDDAWRGARVESRATERGLVIEAVVLALVAPLEPVPMIGFIVVLGSRRGRANGRGFIAGWVASALAVAAVAVVLAGHLPSRDSPTPVRWVAAAEVVVGFALLGLWHHRRRAVTAERVPPRWLAKIDHLGPFGAAAVGAFIQPWPLVAASAAAVLRATPSATGRAAGLVTVVVASASPFAAVLLFASRHPDQADRRLRVLRAWIDAHQRGAVNTVLLIIGLWLVGHGAVAVLAAK